MRQSGRVHKRVLGNRRDVIAGQIDSEQMCQIGERVRRDAVMWSE
jgi:hypothetical protein